LPIYKINRHQKHRFQKKELARKKFEADFENGIYNIDGFDESYDDGFNHIP
jgi:hypothetical protein